MTAAIEHIVIVGGGTAGWLSACLIAARRPRGSVRITLIEAPDIPTVGVGEGTWPTMRGTLATIGIAEADFLRECDASFKQGSRFDGWVTGEADDSYLHPFTPPSDAMMSDPMAVLAAADGRSYAETASPQARICNGNLAPRQAAMPDYSGALNYAYHLDAGKLAAMLKRRACQGLGVNHLSDKVTSVSRSESGNICAVETRENGSVAGDVFIDCTGHAALLIGDTLKVSWIDRSDVLFNDRALVVQQPVDPASTIASQTIATAHAAGWLWDIGLPGRRGIGCVYASQFASDDEAMRTLEAYVRNQASGASLIDANVRQLTFASGHRERFWQGNCLAIGLSAGFLEPLEASAIVMIELSLDMLLDNFPQDRASLPVHAARFNRLFRYRWDRIVDFLKLHYVLSRRNEPYWRAHRDAGTIPDSLSELLEIWRYQPPSRYDFPQHEEVFPAASHQYVFYGMKSETAERDNAMGGNGMTQQVGQVDKRGRALASVLPTNRAYLDALQPAPTVAEAAR